MKWHQSFTRKFTIMNHSKLLRNLKKELVKYPIKRESTSNLSK